ncbi:MAG: leucine-rich repeat protein [Catenibacterium mitsuokai]|nr:leucine-rich repeat protein [Catenibacterium mitsuokai]MCI6075951.1 leucine-rich repeat protein [Catenibacterium mitsuokai]
MMIKKVLAIATALAMTISMASYQSYNAEAADNIYETREVFVADSIIKGTLDKNGNVLNSYSAVSNTIAREYSYKTLAEALIDNKTLVFDSSFWLNLDNALDGNFKSVFKQREVFYETVLMDYLLYGDNSGENTNTFDSETANNFYKISKKLINEANDTYEDNLDDIIANQSLSDAIEFSNKYGFINELNGFTKITDSIKNSVTTAKQYYDRLASALTIKNACVSRVEFLKKIKANSSDNTELCTAIDNLVKKYESGYASLLFNKFVNDAVKDLSDYVWGKVLTEVPGLKELKMGVGKLDEIFKSKDLATCNLNLLFVYIINSKATAATTSLRTTFNNDKNASNSYSFINGYMEYVNYQKYATTVAKSYVNTAKSASPGTSYSALEQSITDDDSMSDSYLRLINTYYNLHNKYYGELTKTVDSGTTDEMNWSLNGKGTLTISGKGDMKSYYYKDRPWYKYKDNIKKVMIEDGITSISSNAFYDCPNLTEVSIANTVTIIESSAFRNCTSLKSISFPSNVTKLGNNVLTNCTSLEDINIPGSVTEIGDYAFSHCTSLENLTLPEGVQKLGCGIIYNTIIESITIPKTVTSCNCEYLGSNTYQGAFYGDEFLKEVVFEEGIESIPATICANASSIEKVTIPSSVTKIGNNAFDGCTGITSVNIPKGVNLIEYYAFYRCTSLKNVNMEENTKKLFKTEIGSYAFSNCTSLKSISFPSNVTKLGNNVLTNCTSLEDINIPGSVTEIGDYAFNGCSSLKSITLPSSITSIGRSIFNNSALETARVYKNSYPLTYCKNNNINYQIIGSFDKATSIQVSNGSCTNIDDNTELKASQVKTGTDYDSVSQSFDNFNLYDIAFYKDDEKVTIDGTAIVRIPVGENMNIDKCKVYYNDNGNYVDMNAVYKEGYMEFETTHFSQYIITDTPLETESDLTVGDVNNDGKVNVLDAVMVLRHDANIIKLDDSQLKAADVNDDGKVDVLDAVMILRYEAGIIKSFN